MGPIEVDGPTEEELRNIAIRQTFEELPGEAKALGSNEYTVRHWMRVYEEEYGTQLSETTARRKLRQLVESGKLAVGRRKSPETGHIVRAYWSKNDDLL